jgi:hypothetical protein
VHSLICYLPLCLRFAHCFGASTSAVTSLFGADLGALSLMGCAFMTDEAMSVVALCSSLTALFVEEQCDYPRPDDTRLLDFKRACV